MATHATHAKGAPPYQTREALCERCGKTFASKKYKYGWTRFCSKSCGARAHRSHPGFNAAFNPETLPLRVVSARSPAVAAAVVSIAAELSATPDVTSVAAMTQPAEQLALDAAAATEPDEPDEVLEASESVAAADDSATDDDAPGRPVQPDGAAGFAAVCEALAQYFGLAPLRQWPQWPTHIAGGVAYSGQFTLSPTDSDDADADADEPQPPTYPLLRTLLDRLPASGATWTRTQYDRWLRAFTASLEMDVVIVEDHASIDREA